MVNPPLSAPSDSQDYTVQTYFPKDDQKFESDLAGQWFQNITFRNENRAPSPLNNSSSALDCAIEASVTTRIEFQLPTSSSSAGHDPARVPAEAMAAFVQYRPDLARQYLQHYETTILSNARRATLSATTASSSPQLFRFLYFYLELSRPGQSLEKKEASYVSFLENMLRVACLLAEVVDNSVCEGRSNGWIIDRESQAYNVKMDLVVKYKTRGIVSLEAKQLKAGESVLRSIENLTPNEGENIALGCGAETAQAALRKVNCDNQYSVCSNSS